MGGGLKSVLLEISEIMVLNFMNFDWVKLNY